MKTRPRARELGIEVGIFQPGNFNAITDVQDVLVGHETVWRGEEIRTGVTCILPHSGNVFQQKVAGATFVANGFGKTCGLAQIDELGEIETPICLTDTINVPAVADAVIEYVLQLPGNEDVRSINPVVGETNMGHLNASRARPVDKTQALAAIENAEPGLVPEGSLGAGTGTQCLGWKGGIGTSSRVLPDDEGGYTVGVLVQSNFGGSLNINGAPVGRELGRYYFNGGMPSGGDSIMMILATDAPLGHRGLKRLAKRAPYGMARAGGISSNGSGDFVIAFSSGQLIEHEAGETTRKVELVPNDSMSHLFQAVQEATEEAIYNSILKAKTVRGRDGNTVEALPVQQTKEILKKYGVLEWSTKLPPGRVE
ncbi:MAG: P1 family peptidase [Candidatus Acetothermia bacterium]